MAQVTLDECLNPALRAKIKKLVDLNLDSDSIWDLLDPNLKNYEDYMYVEVEKYVKYVLWLRDGNRSLDNAYEKYKNYTRTFNRNFKRDLATRLDLEQKRKDQQRIDELSALMKYSRQQNENKTSSSQTENAIELLGSDEINHQANEFQTNSVEELIEIQNSESEHIKELEINEDFNEDDDTESDLDFIDLTTNERNEPSITLNTKDLLFETMTNAANEISEVTIGIPLETATLMENEKTLTIKNPIESNQTNEALDFYHQLEAKYGDEEAKITLTPNAYELGSKITYQNEEYLITKIETVSDFFNNPEVIITLKNIITEATIHINRKQLENEN